MKRNALVIGAVAMVAIIGLWYFLFYSPINDDLSKAQAETSAAEKQTDSLRADLARLEGLAENSTEQQAKLRKLDAAVPENPDLAEFIIQANDIAEQAGISFLSIAPSPPAAGTGSSVIQLTITIQGSYFQLEEYLRQLEKLERLVIIDGITISAGGAESDAATSDGGVGLSVSLTGRMFTQAAPAAEPGTVPTDPSATTTTTAPAGSTDSTSSTTAPAGSSTTGGA